MNRSQLIAAIAKDANLTRAQARAALLSFLGNVEMALKEGEQVRLQGFGTFAVQERPQQEGRNPLTGKPIKIPPRRVARFRSGKALKKAIN